MTPRPVVTVYFLASMLVSGGGRSVETPELMQLARGSVARAELMHSFSRWKAAVEAGDIPVLTRTALVDQRSAVAELFATPSKERDSILKPAGLVRSVLRRAAPINDVALSYRVAGDIPHAFVCVMTRPQRLPSQSADLMALERREGRRDLFCTLWIQEDGRWFLSYDFALGD